MKELISVLEVFDSRYDQYEEEFKSKKEVVERKAQDELEREAARERREARKRKEAQQGQARERCLENVRNNLAVLSRAFDDPTCKAWYQANLATQYKRCVARRIEQMGYSSVKGFSEFRGDGLIRSLESWQLEYANFDVCPK